MSVVMNAVVPSSRLDGTAESASHRPRSVQRGDGSTGSDAAATTCPPVASASARASLLAGAGRVVEAAESLHALLADADSAELAATQLERLLEAHAEDAALLPMRRALLEHRTHVDDPAALRSALLTLCRFELDVAKDSSAQARCSTACWPPTRTTTRRSANARVSRSRPVTSSARACLDRRLKSLPRARGSSELGARDAAARRAGPMCDRCARGDRALVESSQREPALRKVALAALNNQEHAARAVRVLERVAEAIDDKASRAEVYEALFDKASPEALGSSEEALYEAWLATIEDDDKALIVASRAAARVPESDPFWDRAEELARAVKRPEPVAEAYRAVLARTEPPLRKRPRCARRAWRCLPREWFDDQDLVSGCSARDGSRALGARGFERLKLIYNAGGALARAVRAVRPRISAQADDDTRSMTSKTRSRRRATSLAIPSAPSAISSSCAHSQGRHKIESQLERLYERMAATRR